jgi:hypothetical protein
VLRKQTVIRRNAHFDGMKLHSLSFIVRRAELSDTGIIAWPRARMFQDMAEGSPNQMRHGEQLSTTGEKI